MAKKKPELSNDDELNTTPDEGMGGFGYPSYPFGVPQGGAFPFEPYSYGDVSSSASEYDEYEEEPKKKKKEKKPRRRRESDYFYVNRKFPCFLIFLCMILCVALIGISVLGAMPSMKENKVVSMLLEFTALYKKPDMTPKEERLPTVDEEGNEVAYVDQSEYVGFFDVLLGTIKSLFNIGTTEDAKTEGEEQSPAEAVEGEEAAEGGEAAADGGFSMDTPFYDGIQKEVTAKGFTEGLPLTVAKYFALAMVLFILFALYYMIKAFAALFGRRVFKNFGLGSILNLVMAVVVLFGSISVLSIFVTPQGTTAELQFGALTDFLFGGFSAPPEFTFALEEGADAVALPFIAGYGLYAMLVLPIVTLLLSIFARKKLPYAIFD